MSVHLSRADLIALGIEPDVDPQVGVVYPAGPWKYALIVAMSVPVRSKSNYRRGQHGGQRWGQVVEFEGRLREALEWARPIDWPFEGREVSLKDRHIVVGSIYARALLDTSNLSKSVYDAAEGVIYFNDAQIRAEAAFLDRQRKDNLLVCGFAVMDPGMVALDVSEGLAKLNEQVLATARYIADY